MFSRVVVVVTLLTFTACGAMQPLRDFSPSLIRQEVEVGDRVEIVTLQNKAYTLEVLEVGETSLEGHTRNGKRYRIAYESIRQIAVEKLDADRTAAGGLATFGVVIVLFYTVVLIALVSAASELDSDE